MNETFFSSFDEYLRFMRELNRRGVDSSPKLYGQALTLRPRRKKKKRR